jgi:hypothetical protein
LRRLVIAALAALTISGCGGDGLSGSGQELTRGEVSKRVGEAIAAYEQSGADPEARDTLAEAAASLRDCGEDSLAERLERAADG